MAVEALCPICGAVFSLKDEMQGKKVRCTKCEHVFKVGANGKAEDRDEKQAVKSKADAAPKRSVREDDDDEEDDDRPRGKQSKRVYHDDDDDDVEEKSRKRKNQLKRKGPGKKGGGAPVLALVLGGAALAVILLCGVGGFVIYRAVSDAADEAQAEFNAGMQQQMGGPNFGGPDPFAGFGGKQLANIDDALRDLKSAQPIERQNAASWLSGQPLDAGRQAEVAKALDPLLAEADGNVRYACYRAMKVWATADNVPALARALNNESLQGVPNVANDDAMAALARLKDARGADAVAHFLPNFFKRDTAVQALQQMGPVADKAVVKYYHHKDAHDAARRLIASYGSKPDVILTQTLLDIRSADREQRRLAVDWLAGAESNAARQQADAGKQKLVATTLDNLLTTDTDFGIIDATMRALTNGWATTDNVPTLGQCVQNDRFPKRQEAMTLLGKLKDARGAAALASRLPTGDRVRAADALIALGPDAKGEVEKYATNPDQAVQREVKRILQSYGVDGGSIDLKQLLAELKSPNGGRRSAAADKLAAMKVDPARRDEVASALAVAAEDGTDRGAQERAIKALGVWGNKDSGLVLVRILSAPDTPGNCKNAVVTAMKALKDDRVVKPLAAQLLLPNERGNATRHLIELGPDFGTAIEAEVKAGLGGNDKELIKDCCKILGEVGTKAGSVPALTQLEGVAIRQKHKDLQTAAQVAINKIVARGK